jgi:hypothetical protein
MPRQKPSHYVIRDLWIDGGLGEPKRVVLDVLGVGADGSYWLTGFQLTIPKDEYDELTVDEIMARVRSKALENEAALDAAASAQDENIALTEKLRSEDKFVKLKGARVEIG